jgi:transcriptional regulator of arginine metabolism
MKNKRREKILELIATEHMDTQERLLQRLAEEGFTATQATVSRDINALGLIKTRDASGLVRYALPSDTATPGELSRFRNIWSESVIDVAAARNIVVVRCHAGMANAACASVDRMDFDGIVGSLSGDDTFILIMQDDSGAAHMAKRLSNISAVR